MKINFYQIDDVLYKSIVPLLFKVLEENKKALIYCQNEQQLNEIDNSLWSFSKTKFLPHGTKNDKIDSIKQPILLTNKLENDNKANYLIMFCEVEERFLQQFEKIFYFFGSGNIKDARKLWERYKNQSYFLNFYKRDSDGTNQYILQEL